MVNEIPDIWKSFHPTLMSVKFETVAGLEESLETLEILSHSHLIL